MVRFDDLRASVDVVSLLTHYGAKFSLQLNGSATLRSSCVVHGGTNPTSLIYNVPTGVFKCFGECGFTGNVFQLIMAVERCSFKEAVDRAKEFSVGYNGMSVQTAANKPSGWMEVLERGYGATEQNQVINSPLVDRALRNKVNPYVLSGKFLQTTMDYFEVGYCDFNETFMDRAIITIHNEYGQLVGFSGRSMSNKNTAQKYRIKKGFKKGKCLYNLHRAVKHVGPRRPLIVVEGFGQAWRLHEAGLPGVVALMGKDMTDDQYALMTKYSTSIVLGLDFDSAGVEATKKLAKLLDNKVDLTIMTSKYGENVDLGDMSVEMARSCYENRIPGYQWLNERGVL